MARKHTSKLSNVFKIAGLVLVGIVVIAGILIGVDYRNYSVGNRSVLFGTLDKYKSSQTLKFTDLDLKVNSVSLKTYTKPTAPTQTDCSTISSSGIGFWSSLDKFRCEHANSNYLVDSEHYNKKKELLVEFQYMNISDNPINLLDYKVKLIANTVLDDYGSPSKECTGMAKNSSFLKGYTEKECLVKDVGKDYKGPLALSVTHNGREKIINLSIN